MDTYLRPIVILALNTGMMNMFRKGQIEGLGN
jgi:hypothetical protein